MTNDADAAQPESPIKIPGGQGVQIGDHSKQINHFRPTYNVNVQMTARPAVRSAYMEQVKRIAPSELLDRDEEQAELAEFCLGAGQRPYTWWRAPAWAGKSALMSWFVLHQPPGVQVVSFFITARWKGHDDRGAFIDVMLEQLADLLGEPIPAYLNETTRELHMLRMLDEAARRCERLVLVVDGLDEDRGVNTGLDAYSIAALLPARPASSLRIIGAGQARARHRILRSA